MNRSTPPLISSARWGTRTKRIVATFLFLGLALTLLVFAELLPLLIISALFSYILWPIVNFFEYRVLCYVPFLGRSVAVLLTFVTVISAFVTAVILIVPVLVSQLSQVGDRLPELIESIETEAQRFLSQPISFGGAPVLIDGEPIIPLESIEQITNGQGLDGLMTGEDGQFDIFDTLGRLLGSFTGPAFNFLGGAINAIVNFTFLLVIMFYMMRDGEHFIGGTVNLTPRAYQGDARRLFYELGRVWNAYLRGQLVLCISVGVATYIAALVLGLPSAPLLGLLAGILEFIPNIGPFIAAVPAVVLALFSESTTFLFLNGFPYALITAGTWMLIQQLEAIYLVPRVMGGSLDLHPIVVILAVIAGASVAGILGVILAAPFTATVRVFGLYFYGKLFDQDPFLNPKPYERKERDTTLVRVYWFIRQGLTGEKRVVG